VVSAVPVLVKGVTKTFGALTALSDAAISLRAGEVAAIVGENGAGKSTLAKIIAGILPRDAGEIIVNGSVVKSWSRRQAIAAGIGFVPQSLSFVPTLTILENHLLGGEGWRLDKAKALAGLRTAALEMQVDLPFGVPVERLSLAERQLGEIVASVAAGARMLLLDEPTSSLGPIEVERLISTIRRLAAGGTTIGLVTHRIAEVMGGADHITVLRAGRVVLDDVTSGLNPEDIAKLMVGERDRTPPQRASVHSDWQRLVVDGVTLRDDGQMLLDNISFSIRQGEVLAVAGVSGAAQPALAQCIAGLRVADKGRVLLDGVDVTADPFHASTEGLAYIPEDRAEGVVPELAISENASLFQMGEPGFHRLRMRKPSAERAYGRRIIENYDVRPPDPDALAGGLSGGNQQKLLVGRELTRKPGVIVAHGPTQGLDLAAAATIRTALVQAATDGAAVLVISADLDELMEIGHRMIVLAEGKLTAEFDLSTPVDMAALGRAMTGVSALELT
jgi:ABC-type uncharacterized transport system ATPase subunit